MLSVHTRVQLMYSSYIREERNMKQVSLRHRRGFTLIELMVVIVILGILTTIGTFAFMSSQKKARDSRRKSDLTELAKALEMYNNDRGVYPGGTGGKIMGCGASYTAECAWGTTFGKTTAPTVIYMIKLPKDPTETRNYYYEAVTKGYRLYARLENLEDATIPTTGSREYSVLCGTDVYCNYVLMSTNATEPTVKP